MNFYLYGVRIFDTASDANLEVFPRCETHVAIAENKTEAQRKIVEQLFDPTETCGKYSTKEDAADRFHICFDDEPQVERPVEWDEELNIWIFADEDYPPEAKAKWDEYLKSRQM